MGSTLDTTSGTEPYLPGYLSYSQVSRYEECPRSWYLSYARKAEPRQTWFFPMGTAIHESIESYLKTGDIPEFKDLFYPLIAKQMEVDPNHHEWLHAGTGENIVQGQAAVNLGRVCVDNAVKFLEDMHVWEVEYDASCSWSSLEVPVKMYVDIIGDHKKHGPLIVDWKSGKSAPSGIFQLETYRAGLMVDPRYGEVPFNGYWGMLHPEATPKTPRGRLKDLSHVTPEAIGKRFQKAYDGMKATVYKANKSFSCSFCTMQDNCLAHNFPNRPERAVYYDHSKKDGCTF